MKLWDEYKCLEPVPTYTCGVGRKSIEYTSRHKLIQFLMGLNDYCGSICDQILLIEHVPLVAKDYSMVVRVEQQHNTHTHFTEPMQHSAHVVKSRTTRYRNNKRIMIKGTSFVFLVRSQDMKRRVVLNFWVF